ncbi:TetR/AcrR family transcriptional regulator [Paenibacillus silviterrae]|uniref:TetR/AcrR family transcriptional regulator n=1 Tax=Paenibacillus silviterrae TaxID=3242194 RepID=UPI002542A528|nr:TetR/AcrR family transcriptional regulator [Paenibacillus chinjuensis]
MKRTKEEANETIQQLLAIGRAHFTRLGFADTSLEEIAREAKLTRGALYHHFGSKKKLFVAVLQQIQQEIAADIENEASQSEDPWAQLLLGCRAFIASAVQSNNKRPLLIDGPAVLGWEEWRTLDQLHSMKLLQEQLASMQHFFPSLSIEALTHSLSGALNEAALWTAHQSDIPKAQAEAMAVVDHFLRGLQMRK